MATTTYTIYRGFKYSLIAEGKWTVTMPSRLRSTVDAADEDEVKAIIDSVIEGGT